MTLLIFFGWLTLFELEWYRNTGHIITDWTIAQIPAFIAILFYLAKVVASKLGQWIREDEKLKKEYEAENSD